MAARLGKPVSNFERSNSDGTVRLSLELLSGAAERPALLSAVNHLGDKSCYQTIRVITHECTYT